jgi:hypothetical protein
MGGVTHGGRRQGSGRHCRDTVRISASVERPVYQELIRQEKETGVYRCQIVGRIVTEHLVGGIVDRESVRLAPRLETGDGRNGSNGQGSPPPGSAAAPVKQPKTELCIEGKARASGENGHHSLKPVRSIEGLTLADFLYDR